MRIDNRKWASGLLVKDGDVPGFRFAVTLGIADHLGHRPDLISHLEGMLAAHLATEPVPPAPAGPEDAPAGMLPGLRDALPKVSPRLPLATGAGALSLALVLGLFGLLGSFSSGEDLCGAAANPYGYNYCGGSVVTDPRTDTCDYFSCGSLSGGKGYLVRCSDGALSLTGGRPNACASHDGVANTVYQ